MTIARATLNGSFAFVAKVILLLPGL